MFTKLDPLIFSRPWRIKVPTDRIMVPARFESTNHTIPGTVSFYAIAVQRPAKLSQAQGWNFPVSTSHGRNPGSVFDSFLLRTPVQVL